MSAMPTSMAGNHEMRDYHSNQDPPRSSPHTAPSITPYLGLRARLSQIWLNRWTILLLLVLARTLIAIAGVDDNLGSARREALSACSSVENMGSAMASMPHYMSQGVNELAASGVEKAVQGLEDISVLGVTAIEELVVFVIGMMTNTYLCLITVAVSGSLHAVINVLDSAQADLNKLTSQLGGDMGDALSKFTSAYQKILDALSKIPFGTFSITPPTAPNLTAQINSLKSLQLPSGLDDDLKKLNNSIPSFAQVKNVTETIIRLPFEEVKGLMRKNLGNYTFDRSAFPVPAKEQLTFCSDNDGINDFFDKMVVVAQIARKIFIGVLPTAALLVCIPMAYREIRRWRMMQARSHLISTHCNDPMDVVYIVSRPYTSSAGLKLAGSTETERRRSLIRWVIAYATSEAALFVLALALAGLFACACQYALLKSLEKEIPSLTNQVGAFSDKVLLKLNNASQQWAIGTNAVIASTNKDINDQMLGWVGTSTEAVNKTLNTFVDMTVDVLNSSFGGTPLYEPILDVVNCLLFLKIQGIEKALTWVHDNAHITIPSFSNDTFSLGAAASLASDSSDPGQSFLSSPGDAATDKISSAVARFINSLQSTIRVEAIISTVILLVWLFVVLIAIIRALSLWFGRDKTRGTGGAIVHYPPDTPVNATAGFTSDNQDRFVNVPLHEVNNRPFTPAPKYSEIRESIDAVSNKQSPHKVGIAVSTNPSTKPPNSRNQIQEEKTWDPENRV